MSAQFNSNVIGEPTYNWQTNFFNANTPQALYTPAAGKKFLLKGMQIILNNQAFLTGGGSVTGLILDGASELLTFSFLPPTVAPTTGITQILFSMDDMRHISAAANNVLSAELSSVLTAGNVIVNFGVIDV